MKKEYLIVGSDNFWYACGLTSKKEVKEKIEDIKENIESYGSPNGDERQYYLPETLYVYEAKEIDRIDLSEDEEENEEEEEEKKSDAELEREEALKKGKIVRK